MHRGYTRKSISLESNRFITKQKQRMATFKIEVRETLSRLIEIEAQSIDEAYLKAKEMYSSQEIVLDADDFVEMELIKIE